MQFIAHSQNMLRALILLYHRVAETRSDPWALGVSPRHFEEHLRILASRYTVVGLDELRSAAQSGVLPKRAVAVTIDDGYLDVLTNAMPLLKRHDVPATLFVVTGALGSRREFWWDELERVILQSPTLPVELRLTAAGKERRWDLGSAPHLPVGDSYPGWRAWGQPDPTVRHGLYRALYELLYDLSETERLPLQDQLLAWSGATPLPESGERCVISEDQLLALAQDSLITIGSHSVTHPLLSAAPPHVQFNEIVQSKAHLESVLARPVTAFAYPFGKDGDYTADTVALVREAGYTSGYANRPGLVAQNTDPFQLPRIFMFDCDGQRFADQMEGWFAE